jgi:hypothetical protein
MWKGPPVVTPPFMGANSGFPLRIHAGLTQKGTDTTDDISERFLYNCVKREENNIVQHK